MTVKFLNLLAAFWQVNAVKMDRTSTFLGQGQAMKMLTHGAMKAEVSSEVHEHLHNMAMALLDPSAAEGRMSINEGLREVQGKMDVKAAARVIAHQNLPDDIRDLVLAQTQSQEEPHQFEESSMDKARVALNELVEKAWVELDDKIIECKEYQEMNRATFEQVVTDISRLVEQITDLERIESESLEGIAKMEFQIKLVEEEISKATKEYNRIYAKNSQELTRKQNDLDVFQFILTYTKCPDATSFLQRSASFANETRICHMQGGGHALCSHNQQMQAKLAQLMRDSHHSRSSLSNLLAEIQEGQRQDPTTTANPAIAASMGTDTIPVKGGDEPAPKGFVPAPFCCEAYGVACGGSGGGIMCSPEPIDCGLLHDKLSLMWGEYKDEVDKLTMEMNKNAYMFEELIWTLNGQIKILTNSKARFNMLLSEARSNLAADREEMRAKTEQREELEKQYRAFMKLCCERIKWIMFQDMCAIIIVRNAVLHSSSECPGDQIVDCDVDFWVPKECTVRCDDDCPDVPDPSQVYECGGWQEIYRKVVVSPPVNSNLDPPAPCGLRCPTLTKTMKCNQKKCPVDCVMSEWSGWSKCTAECEGGVRGHTRSIITKPLNGGQWCNTQEETEACNTMSCDRDCMLASWTDWSPCSVACGGGMQEREKHVLIPTRGFGKCPKEHGPDRFEERECNTQDCVGDEICVANMDLIIAVDGSGSVRADGFDLLKSYAKALVERYRSRYFGNAAMKVGVIEFGNGIIMDDGVTVSPAMNVQPLTTELASVTSAIDSMVQKRGFTNMAQAFALAESMYTSTGRKGSTSAILTVTDGKPSFEFQTEELVEQLDDKGVMRYFVVLTDNDKELDLMKKWASAPWETNLLHVAGGMVSMEADEGVWVEKALTMFCPAAYSPQLAVEKESSGGFMHLKDGGYCGGRGSLLSTTAKDAEACAFLAQGAGVQAFLLGTWFRRGYCFAGDLTFDSAQYTSWEGEREDPSCEGGWESSAIYDFYVLQPAA